jgi:hypothetical protein
VLSASQKSRARRISGATFGAETKHLAERILGSAREDELQHQLQAGRLLAHRSPPGLPQRRVLADHGQSLGRARYLPAARAHRASLSVPRRFQRRDAEVDALVRRAFLLGISTRQLGAVTEWEGFLEDLHRRGLAGAQLRLIATDNGVGWTRLPAS